MKPIRAYYNYTVDVPIELGNPLHEPYLGGEYAVEKRQSPGFVTEVLILDDTFTGRLLDGIKTNKDGVQYSDYKDQVMSRSGVYVVFWEDKDTHYQMRVEDFSSITVSNGDMRNYVYTT